MCRQYSWHLVIAAAKYILWLQVSKYILSKLIFLLNRWPFWKPTPTCWVSLLLSPLCTASLSFLPLRMVSSPEVYLHSKTALKTLELNYVSPSDIQFWNSRQSLEGLSVRSIIFGVFQSLVVLLYILDNETNFVVQVSVFIGLLIDLWKITKVMDVRVSLNTTSCTAQKLAPSVS